MNKETADAIYEDFMASAEGREEMGAAFNDFQSYCHGLALRSGWWHNKDGSPKDITNVDFIAAKIALMHSELSEALEGLRKGVMDDHLPHRTMLEVEFADTIIRVLDTAGALGLNVGDALVEKLYYNQQRADHKPENRFAAGGKSI
jgi:hypothetical protein